jgi:hypothetical protein
MGKRLLALTIAQRLGMRKVVQAKRVGRLKREQAQAVRRGRDFGRRACFYC